MSRGVWQRLREEWELRVAAVFRAKEHVVSGEVMVCDVLVVMLAGSVETVGVPRVAPVVVAVRYGYRRTNRRGLDTRTT